MLSKISDIGFVGTGTTPSMKNDEYYESKDIMFIKPSDISDSSITEIITTENYISNKARTKARLFPKDTILCVCIGSIGKIGVTTQESSCNQQINYIIANEKHIPKFIAYSLAYIKSQLLDIGADGPVVPIINKTRFENIYIKTYDKTTEKSIANSLDLINDVIKIKQNELLSLDELIKSRFIEMFMDENNNDKYPIKKWRDVVNVKHGKDYKQNIVENRGYPVYGSGGFMDVYVDNYLVDENATIIGRKGTIDKPIFVKEKFWNVDTAFGIIVNKKILNPLFFFVRSTMYDLKSMSNSTTLPSMTKDTLYNIEIGIPPIDLQNEFANFVEQIDKSKFVYHSRYFLCEILTFDSSTIAYSNVVSIFA